MQLIFLTQKIGIILILSIQMTYSLPIKSNHGNGEVNRIISGEIPNSSLSKRQLNLPINLLSSTGKDDNDSSNDDDENQKGTVLGILPLGGGQPAPAPPLGAAPLPPLILGLASNMKSDD